MLKIELEPCYPEGQTIEDQKEKLLEEWMEIVEADSWENKVSEYIDLAQVSTGVVGLRGKEKIIITMKDIEEIFKELDSLDIDLHSHLCVSHEILLATTCSKDAIHLAKISLCCACELISRFADNKEELLKSFLKIHYQKLESRRKEWASNGTQTV